MSEGRRRLSHNLADFHGDELAARLSNEHDVPEGGEPSADSDGRLRPFVGRHFDKLAGALEHTAPAGTSRRDDALAYMTANYDLPTFEVFCDSLESDTERDKFFEDVQLHQFVYCAVKQLMADAAGVVVKLLCTHGEPRRDLEAVDLKVFIPFDNCGGLDANSFSEKQLLKVRVSLLDRVNRLLTLTIDDECGPIQESELPTYFTVGRRVDERREDYARTLRRRATTLYRNGRAEKRLHELLAVADTAEPNDAGAVPFLSFVDALNTASWKRSDFADHMRRAQSHELSMKSVVRGVEHIKARGYAEALQCLNKALHVEEDNVEALVARGATMIHMENYEMAAKDLEAAVALQADHGNAREYLLSALDRHADNLLDSLAREGRTALKAAVAANRRILQLEPDNAKALDRHDRLRVHLQASDKKRARKRRHAHSHSSDVLSASSDDAEKSRTTADGASLGPPRGELRSMVEHYARRTAGGDRLERARVDDGLKRDAQLGERVRRYYDMYANKAQQQQQRNGDDGGGDADDRDGGDDVQLVEETRRRPAAATASASKVEPPAAPAVPKRTPPVVTLEGDDKKVAAKSAAAGGKTTVKVDTELRKMNDFITQLKKKRNSL